MSQAAPARPLRVVLVDGVPEVRRSVHTALTYRGGFEVVGEASTGMAAVSLVEELAPDLLVLDPGLPDIAGHDVLTRVRDVRPQTKVVILTGVGEEDLDYLVDRMESTSRADEEAVVELPQQLASVRSARSFVGDRLVEWGVESMLDDALIVVSELAANAITHAASDYRVRLVLTDATLRIEVRDGGPGSPEPRERNMSDEQGRGLLLVSALSSSWGFEDSEGHHKVVWADLVHRADHS